MKRVSIILLLLLLVAGAMPAAAQQKSGKIQAQEQVVKDLERKIAEQERQISKLRSGKSQTQEQVRRLGRQLETRTRLLGETEKQAALLQEDLSAKEREAGALTRRLAEQREQYANMVREAYRNYRHHNYLTYLFSAENFREAAHRMLNLRSLAAMRERTMGEIAALNVRVQEEKAELEQQHRSLDSVSRKLTAQRSSLQRDVQQARQSLKKLSQKEKQALQRKQEQEQQLETAVAALRKMTKGNTAGASFSASTSGLNLPVAGGRVKRYKGNMAEITGPRGARVRSIYEGKVVEVKQNRITGQHEVYIAHGEYITTYTNLATVSVSKGAKVERNGQIGTIGASMNFETMDTEYKIVFGIYPPDPKRTMLASECFKKK